MALIWIIVLMLLAIKFTSIPTTKAFKVKRKPIKLRKNKNFAQEEKFEKAKNKYANRKISIGIANPRKREQFIKRYYKELKASKNYEI